MAEKLVKEIMHSGIIGCRPETPLTEVVRILSDADIHALVVAGESGEVVGIISHMDVIPLRGTDLSAVTAADIMTRRVIGVEPDVSVSEAVAVMVKSRIHRLVVTEAAGELRIPVGILSTTDIVREMRGSKWTWYV